MSREVSAPIILGQRLPDLSTFVSQANASRQVSGAGIRASAEGLLKSYKHRRSRFLDIDYRLDDDGFMQLHIFPRVPDYDQFLPDEQSFARALEKAVILVLGRAAQVEAEFHERLGLVESFTDSVGPDGKPTAVSTLRPGDTRVKTYYRTATGEITSVLFSKSVPKVWLCVKKIPGLMMPKARALELIVESCVEITEQLLPRA